MECNVKNADSTNRKYFLASKLYSKGTFYPQSNKINILNIEGKNLKSPFVKQFYTRFKL